MRERPNPTDSKTVLPPGTVASNPTPSAAHSVLGVDVARIRPYPPRESDGRQLAGAQRARSLLCGRRSLGVRGLRFEVAVFHPHAAASAAGDVLVVGDEHDRDALVVAELGEKADDVGR